MKRFFIFFLTLLTFTTTPKVAFADVSGLTPCKDSAVFKRRLDGSVKKLTSRLENYEEGIDKKDSSRQIINYCKNSNYEKEDYIQLIKSFCSLI